MKVLAICHEDPEFILGGMGMHCRELYRAMAKRGDADVHFLTSGPGEGSQPYLGYTKHQSDKLVLWKPHEESMTSLLLSDIQLLKTLARVLAQGHRFDLIHVHEWNALQVAWAARDALQVPLVGTMHLCMSKLREVDTPLDGNAGGIDKATLYMLNQEGRLVVESDALILCSQAYVDIAHETFMTQRHIDLVYNGINLEEWHPRAGSGTRAWVAEKLPARPIALYVGRIATMKGIETILDAVGSQDSGYCVVLAGEVNACTEEAREGWSITKRIRALEATYPERLRWVGFRHGQPLKDLYDIATVVLMPSVHEPFGIVALEAMAMGTPLVATEVDGLGEVVKEGDHEFALIIPPRSPGAILEALKACEREEVQAELSELGRIRAQHFSWDEAARKTVDVYHRVLGEQPCQSP